VQRDALIPVAGGCLLVAGLWIASLSAGGSTLWLFGALLVVHGLAGLLYGGWRLFQRS
jgi:hypothetical protein